MTSAINCFFTLHPNPLHLHPQSQMLWSHLPSTVRTFTSTKLWASMDVDSSCHLVLRCVRGATEASPAPALLHSDRGPPRQCDVSEPQVSTCIHMKCRMQAKSGCSAIIIALMRQYYFLYTVKRLRPTDSVAREWVQTPHASGEARFGRLPYFFSGSVKRAAYAVGASTAGTGIVKVTAVWATHYSDDQSWTWLISCGLRKRKYTSALWSDWV